MDTAVTTDLYRSKALTLALLRAHPDWLHHLDRYPALRALTEPLQPEAIVYVHSDCRLTGIPIALSTVSTAEPLDAGMREDGEWQAFCRQLLGDAA